MLKMTEEDDKPNLRQMFDEHERLSKKEKKVSDIVHLVMIFIITVGAGYFGYTLWFVLQLCIKALRKYLGE